MLPGNNTGTVFGFQHITQQFLTLTQGVQRTAEVEREIAEFCKRNIAKNAQPSEIEFTDALPTTKIGKVNYREFQEKE